MHSEQASHGLLCDRTFFEAADIEYLLLVCGITQQKIGSDVKDFGGRTDALVGKDSPAVPLDVGKIGDAELEIVRKDHEAYPRSDPVLAEKISKLDTHFIS